MGNKFIQILYDLLDWFYKKPELEKIIPNVFQFKDPIKYWENFYTTLINQC